MELIQCTTAAVELEGMIDQFKVIYEQKHKKIEICTFLPYFADIFFQDTLWLNNCNYKYKSCEFLLLIL